MPRTSEDLVREALSIVGAAPAGQPVAAEDAALVRGKIGPKLAELASRRILYVQALPAALALIALWAGW